MKVYCTKKCFYGGKVFVPGEYLNLSEGIELPSHFSEKKEGIIGKRAETKEEIAAEKQRALEAVGHGIPESKVARGEEAPKKTKKAKKSVSVKADINEIL